MEQNNQSPIQQNKDQEIIQQDKEREDIQNIHNQFVKKCTEYRVSARIAKYHQDSIERNIAMKENYIRVGQYWVKKDIN